MSLGIAPGEVIQIPALANGATSSVYGLHHGRSSRFPRGIEFDCSNYGAATGNVTVEGAPTPAGPWRVLGTFPLATPAPQRVERSVPFWRVNNGGTGPVDVTLTGFD